MRRRGIGHLIAFVLIIIVLIIVAIIVVNYYSERQLRNSYITGTFQGYSEVNTGEGDQYIVKISNATVTCDSWTMSANDIYTLTHATAGEKVTMSLECTNVVVG